MSMLKLLFMLLISFSLFGDPIEEAARRFMHQKGIPGMSLVVIEKGKSRFYNLGVADPSTGQAIKEDTIFEIASITKVFTSTAVSVEVLEGKMKLEAPVSTYLPALRGMSVHAFKGVTLQQLLTHTASLPRDLPLRKKKYDLYSVMHYLSSWSPPYPLGSRYVYSNLGFGIAGYALEGVMKLPLLNIYHQLILNPLGMHSTQFQLSPPLMPLFAVGTTKSGKRVGGTKIGPLPGAGALRSTAYDMEKFLAANMGVRGPKKLLEAMKFAQAPRFDVGKNNLELGLGWQNILREGVKIIDKNGGLPGFSSYIGFLPEQEIGIVILANRAKIGATQFGRRLLIRHLYQEGLKEKE